MNDNQYYVQCVCLLYLFLHMFTCSAQHIGLLVMATGKYTMFVKPLIESAESYFLPLHKRTYFIFTDHIDEIPKAENIVPIYQERLGWPYDTMMRCKVYVEHQDLYNDLDYMYACDADMLFVDTVGNEILSDRVATQHPGAIGRRGTYENNPKGRAYVADNEGAYYLAGGFYGGSRTEFITINETIYARIMEDLNNGIMPLWHDESHLNRYFIDFKPTLILPADYCYPEGWKVNYHPRLMALNKNHAQMRER